MPGGKADFWVGVGDLHPGDGPRQGPEKRGFWKRGVRVRFMMVMGQMGRMGLMGESSVLWFLSIQLLAHKSHHIWEEKAAEDSRTPGRCRDIQTPFLCCVH